MLFTQDMLETYVGLRDQLENAVYEVQREYRAIYFEILEEKIPNIGFSRVEGDYLVFENYHLSYDDNQIERDVYSLPVAYLFSDEWKLELRNKLLAEKAQTDQQKAFVQDRQKQKEINQLKELMNKYPELIDATKS